MCKHHKESGKLDSHINLTASILNLVTAVLLLVEVLVR